MGWIVHRQLRRENAQYSKVLHLAICPGVKELQRREERRGVTKCIPIQKAQEEVQARSR